MPNKINVLLVEDELDHSELILRGFERWENNFIISSVSNLTDAKKIIKESPPQLIISDWRLPDGEGTELIIKDEKNNLFIPIILMTSYGNEFFAVEAMKLGAMDYIVKSPEIFADIAHISERALVQWENIVARRQVEEQVNKLSSAVEQSEVIIVITNEDGIIEYVNPKFENITGYSKKEAIGNKPNILKSGYTKASEYSSLWKTVKNGQQWRGEFFNKKKNGELFWELVTISPIKNKDGEIKNFLKIGTDITKDKKLQDELRQALDKAEESNKLKTTILANMNHELRTPLMGILGMAEILLDEIEESSQVRMLNAIKSSGKRLMSTLNSILDLSELESDRSLITFAEYPLSETIPYLIEPFIQSAELKGLTFTTDVKDDLIILVYERFFHSAIAYILDNAIKYTEIGEIKLLASKVERDGKDFAKISVIDTGRGIEREKIDIVFEEFRQESEGTNRVFEGTGLGLPIAKRMIKLMNGYITVNSEVGVGSEFSVYLPIADALYLINDDKNQESAVKYSTHHKMPTDLEILCVEDNDVNQEVTQLFLKDLGTVDSVFDGKSAIEFAKAKRYSLILMDINLGLGMDGIQAAREIKNLPGYHDVPIIATTGFCSPEDSETILNNFDFSLIKPFEKNDLINCIRDLIK